MQSEGFHKRLDRYPELGKYSQILRKHTVQTKLLSYMMMHIQSSKRQAALSGQYTTWGSLLGIHTHRDHVIR
jgi:hypothetical protein